MGPSSYDRGGASQLETKRALLTPDKVMNMREDELLAKTLQKTATRLTQRRYDDDPWVKGRAGAGRDLDTAARPRTPGRPVTGS